MREDYISRTGLIALFRKVAEGVGEDCPWNITAIETLIESAPAADVVSVADYQQALETVEKIRGDAYMRHRQALEAEEELLDAKCPVCGSKYCPPDNGGI